MTHMEVAGVYVKHGPLALLHLFLLVSNYSDYFLQSHLKMTHLIPNFSYTLLFFSGGSYDLTDVLA